MLLNGFAFSSYRSFGHKLVKISPLQKVNLIIGQNNVGKSNIIRFLNDQYSFFTSRSRNRQNIGEKIVNKFTDLDRHISNKQQIHKIAFPLLNNEIDEYISKKLTNESQKTVHIGLAKKILREVFLCDKDCIWFVYKANSPTGPFDLDIELKFDYLVNLLDHREWQNLWSSLTKLERGDLKQHWIPETIQSLAYVPLSCPNVEIIPAIRKIGLSGTEASDYSGEGIIERLAKIQNPPLTSQKDKNKFIAINNFLQNVLENPSAQLEIPYERNMILVHMDGKTLPLESLGTGVHEVIILAAAATLLEDTILCIEEPELHLHPLLQKKLVKYLSVETSNQYFFTTHSAHLLDAVEAEIFHVTYKDGASDIEAISSTKQKSKICNDLGYKASDILQANCIVWVEGPSDRIYLNYWVKNKRPDLIEGVHYSIMFYGGGLYSHLTALDEDEEEEILEDLIAVRRLNRNAVIMFDSDKPSARSKISATKQRLKNEFNTGPGFAWVTKGREVENYLDMNKVEEAVLSVHPSAEKLIQKDQWSNLLIYEKKGTRAKKTASKVKVAKHYTSLNPPDFDVLDLNNRIDELIAFIFVSNGH
ncbi:MAG: AAA family ATPase [Pseudomonadota bacterium]